jgi:hypothetical protein
MLGFAESGADDGESEIIKKMIVGDLFQLDPSSNSSKWIRRAKGISALINHGESAKFSIYTLL